MKSLTNKEHKVTTFWPWTICGCDPSVPGTIAAHKIPS